MKIILLVGCSVLLVAAGCKREAPPAGSPPTTTQSGGVFPGQPGASSAPAQPVSEWVKVKIDAQGAVFVNKKPMASEEFSKECARLKEAGGAIVLFVATSNHLASPAQASVIRRIVDAGVPMKMALNESDLE